MKHIEAAWIEQIVKFDEPIELQEYLSEMKAKGVQYSIIELNDCRIRLRKQYNKNKLLKEG